MYKATVIVKRRPKILDPQGKAVEQGAKLLGFNNVDHTRIGKYIEFNVNTDDQNLAEKEVKEYCEENIEAGSIHYHALMSTLREGTSRHTNFLGLGAVGSLESKGYTLLPIDSTKNQTEVEAIIAKAPIDQPVRIDYNSDLEFIRAKLRYRVALNASSNAVKNKGKIL